MNSKYFQVLLNFMLFSSKEIIFMLVVDFAAMICCRFGKVLRFEGFGGRILGILDVVIDTSVGITLL
jgi:hypothetical protein